jgi:hypothetical protein
VGNIFDMINSFNQAQNPQAMFEQILSQNPQMAQGFNALRNSTQGSNPKDIAMQLAKQRGIPEQQVMQMFNALNKR